MPSSVLNHDTVHTDLVAPYVLLPGKGKYALKLRSVLRATACLAQASAYPHSLASREKR